MISDLPLAQENTFGGPPRPTHETLMRRGVLFAVLQWTLLFLVAPAGAQPTGSIEGVVVDANNAPLPGVVVELAGPAVERETVNGLDGTFTFTELPTGDYLVTVALSGFETWEVAIPVRQGETAQVTAVLQIERLMETLTVVAEAPRTFATNVVAEPMIAQQAAITSVLAVVDNLPGVSIQEGDSYGFDDWSSSITMRGFQVLQDEAQIGTTIDGFPNGTSDYWSGGSKANRFVDTANMGSVEVSQGTADVASRSIEALGGTFHFSTADPKQEAGYTASITLGEHDAQRYYVRADTGSLFGGETYAWFSAVRQVATDWVQGSAGNERDHLAAKIVSSFGRVDLAGYFSHDDVHEENYQRLFAESEFLSNPEWDRLIGEWTDIPYINQVYRPGWQTIRANTFGYLKADVTLSDVSSLSAGTYYHRNRGRGGWIPPFVVDVTDDAGGPESELRGGRSVRGGSPLGRIYFVDGSGVALSPAPGCVSTITFPYGGAGPEYDPACHPEGAIPVQTFRRAHYGKDRVGVTLDGEWLTDIGASGNRLRAGIWYENARRDLSRNWHQVIDVRAGIQHDHRPYWRQYDWQFPQDIFKWYVEDTVYAGPVALSGGVKQFLVGLARTDRFGATPDLAVESDSAPLLSGGVTYETPAEGLELFAGYAQNFKVLSPRLLEIPGRNLDDIEPETADNVDIGVRYAGDRAALTATWYDIDFDNRIFFLSPQTTAGPDYLVAGGGSYFNAGGVDSRGVELSGTLRVTGSTSVYAAYTFNRSRYVGTGDPLVDEAQGVRPGSAPPGVPERLWVLSLDRTRDVVSTGISGKYTSARAVTLDGSWFTDGYLLVDAYLTFALDAVSERLTDLELSLVANNLLDKRYLASITGQGAFLGAPRTISSTITVSF